MSRDHPLKAIFNPPIRYGEPTYTGQIGVRRHQFVAIGTAAETDTAGAVTATMFPSYYQLLVNQGATNYWKLQTARNLNDTEPDLIGVLNMTMDGGSVPALSADDGPLLEAGDKGVTFAIADTERIRVNAGFDTRQNFSWSGWYRTSSLSGNGPMFFQFSNLTGTSYLFLIHRDDRGGLVVQIGAPPAGASFLDPGSYNLADSVWHHIALTRSYNATNTLDTWTLYLDGSQISQTTASAMGFTPANTPSSGSLAIAGRTDGDSNVYGGDAAHIALKVGGSVWTSGQVAAQWAYAA